MPASEMPGWAAAWRPDPRWANVPPVNPDDLALLRATVEHRAFVAAVEAFVTGHRSTQPQLDFHLSLLGAWVHAELLTGRGDVSILHVINELHRQVHCTADEILDLHAQNRNPEALAKLVELNALRDTLHKQLAGFKRQSWAKLESSGRSSSIGPAWAYRPPATYDIGSDGGITQKMGEA
jgi:hypothetical protein